MTVKNIKKKIRTHSKPRSSHRADSFCEPREIVSTVGFQNIRTLINHWVFEEKIPEHNNTAEFEFSGYLEYDYVFFFFKFSIFSLWNTRGTGTETIRFLPEQNISSVFNCSKKRSGPTKTKKQTENPTPTYQLPPLIFSDFFQAYQNDVSTIVRMESLRIIMLISTARLSILRNTKIRHRRVTNEQWRFLLQK